MTRDILLFLHIGTAILILGGLAFMEMVVPGMVRDGRENLPALRKLHALSGVFGPSAAIVFLLGIALVLKTRFEFSETWLSASMLLFIVAAVNGAVFKAKTMQRAITAIDEGHPVDAEASRLGMLGGINILILLTITYLMVAKPGGAG